MSIRLSAALMLSLVACGANGGNEIHRDNDLKSVASFQIESSSGSLDGIRVGMSKRDLMSLNYSFTRRSITMEGDEYDVIDVLTEKDVTIECVLNYGKVEIFSTISRLVHDEKKIGVGSTLAELRSAYPLGRVLVGDEDGRYANFVNGSRVIFEINKDEIDSSCFESPQGACDLDSNLKVVKVVVNLSVASP